MSNNAFVAWLAGIILFTGAAIVFGFGWWGPNMRMWQECGADQTFAVMRGVFEKPDALTCFALRR
ncbi:hypothetical protein EDD29_2060 [Actinocorallia herbida]|uniref:Uncharacterized protein n=1 Tax=Actinocorallia herbida TaxID=58109 RepID=A0A3N1CT95_9ACTN|nr:hypothetical protein [Actinocorallia herbida]ROO84533.1 hypothetical protein EDD29_2060 [Actinocorallia herbida]